VGSQGDSGVTARLFGEFLTWLNDRTTDVFVVATSNDIAKLPPEFSRAERFDGVFFLDLPSQEERELIWQYYIQHYQIDLEQQRPRDHDWTGAEIQSCCRLAALLDVPLRAAAQNVVPVAVSAQDAVERLRTWADGRCLCAAGGGIYRQRDTSAPAKRRAVRS
jgi:SpoVK/Ycf46/Vps4 family AAA+-type ATPase